MAATSTLEKSTEFAGDYKLLRVTYTPTAASELVVITAATHGITEIMAVFPKLQQPNTSGAAGACSLIYATFSGLNITCVTSTAAAAAATAWTGITGELLIIGR
jgi:hypothetical protein